MFNYNQELKRIEKLTKEYLKNPDYKTYDKIINVIKIVKKEDLEDIFIDFLCEYAELKNFLTPVDK